VRDAFRDKGVVTMQADWTSADPQVTEALAEFGRNAVPLYVLYVPGQSPQILPQILTSTSLLEYLQELPSQ
jgi:thiol:disulfide interchange protein DsbD